MKDPHIIQMRIGFTGPVVITSGTDSVLVDTGVRGKMHEFERQFQLHGIDPGTIRLIILTHVHYDHTGNLQELKKLTGAPVVVNKREAEWLRTGIMPIPRGTYFFSRMIVTLGDLLLPGYASPMPFEADILTDEYMDLSPYGIRGEIIFTPGHTEGSQSVLVGKNLIAGDCFFNIRSSLVFPPFANDIPQLLSTWEKVFDMGVETIYPGHGPRLNVEDAKKAYQKRISVLKA